MQGPCPLKTENLDKQVKKLLEQFKTQHVHIL